MKCTATFYIQLEPILGYGIDPETGERRVVGTKAVGMTQSRPNKPKANTITVKMQVRVPSELFLPLRPTAVIELPSDLGVLATPVEVEALDDGGDLEASS